MNPPKNPAAFPRTPVSDGVDLVGGQTGMTLRDWFAGQVAAGLAGNTDIELRAFFAESTADPAVAHRMFAEFAYRQADALLVAREGGAS